MKKIRIGLFAIVAVLAMSFTVAEHEGAFKKETKKVDGVCTPSTTFTGTLYNQSCDQVTLCTQNPVFIANPVAVSGLGFDCPGSPVVFCCATLGNRVDECTGNDFEINSIICGQPK